jgi:sugar phosphate isomerase/epimerase
MKIGSMFFQAPTADEARRFFEANETEALEISLPITSDRMLKPIRQNILDCGAKLPAAVSLHEVLPLALAHRQKEFRDKLTARIKDDLKLAGDAGIGIFTLHTTCTRAARSLERGWRLGETRWLARAMDLDVTTNFDDSVRALIDLLRALSPIAQAGRVTIALENNFRDEKFFGRRLDSIADLNMALDAAKAPNTAVCFDVYKAFSTEDSLPDAIRGCRNRVANVHASDIEHMDTSFHHKRKIIGDGMIEWPAVLQALIDVKYDGAIILEMMNSADDVRESARRLREMIAATTAAGDAGA